VERLRAKGRWMNVELNERDKDTDKQERRERIKKYNRGSMRGVWQRKFGSTWEERVQEKEKWWRDLDVGTRREKTDREWKERKEGAECAMRRERNGEKYWMKTEGR
jgi:hypothetical protein